MHRSGDIKTSMMSGIDRLTRRPVFAKSLPAPAHLTNALGKPDFQHKYKSLPGISHAYNEVEEYETHDTNQVNFAHRDYTDGGSSSNATQFSKANTCLFNEFPVNNASELNQNPVSRLENQRFDRAVNHIGHVDVKRQLVPFRNTVRKPVTKVLENIIASTACVDKTIMTGTVRDLSLHGKKSVIPGISKRSQNQEEHTRGILNKVQSNYALAPNPSVTPGVNPETMATHTDMEARRILETQSLYGKQSVIPGIIKSSQNLEYINSKGINRVQSSLALKPNPDVIFDMHAEELESHTEMESRRILETQSLYGKKAVIPGISKASQNQESLRTGMIKRVHSSYALPQNPSITLDTKNEEVHATRILETGSLYGEYSVLPGCSKKIQPQEDISSDMITRVHSSYEVTPNHDTHSLYGKQSVLPGISKFNPNKEDTCNDVIMRARSCYKLGQNPETELEMDNKGKEVNTECEAKRGMEIIAYNALQSLDQTNDVAYIAKCSESIEVPNFGQGRITISGDMLNDNEHDACYNQHVSEGSNNTISYKRREVMREDESLSINVAHSYETSPSERSKSAESETNKVNEVNNVSTHLNEPNDIKDTACTALFSDSLKSSKYDQGHNNIEGERMAEMLNEIDNDKCYTEHVSEKSDNTLSYKRRELMRKDDSISIHLAYSYETSQSEKSKSAELDTNNVKEINNVIATLDKENDMNDAAHLASSSESLKRSKYDQGHSNIIGERMAEMLNVNDNDKCYSEHVSEKRNDITSCKRREFMREDESISINVAYSYETSQSEKSKSAESEAIKVKEVNTVSAHLNKATDIKDAAPCSESLKCSKYDQGHINITGERVAEMLNENDNDKCYSEHISEKRNDITSCKRREFMREDESISINVAYSYETSQRESLKSAETEANKVNEVDNVSEALHQAYAIKVAASTAPCTELLKSSKYDQGHINVTGVRIAEMLNENDYDECCNQKASEGSNNNISCKREELLREDDSISINVGYNYETSPSESSISAESEANKIKAVKTVSAHLNKATDIKNAVPCSESLKSSKYDQGQINITGERVAEMLNVNDNDKCYSEHISEKRNDITSCKRREFMREDESVSINVAYSYETSQRESSKSAESEANKVNEVDNVSEALHQAYAIKVAASTAPCSESLKSSKYDQGQINITGERMAEMLNENDNDKCYTEHVYEKRNDITSCKRRELMREDESISIHVAYSYETSPSEMSKSAVSDEPDANNVKEVNNVIVPLDEVKYLKDAASITPCSVSLKNSKYDQGQINITGERIAEILNKNEHDAFYNPNVSDGSNNTISYKRRELMREDEAISIHVANSCETSKTEKSKSEPETNTVKEIINVSARLGEINTIHDTAYTASCSESLKCSKYDQGYKNITAERMTEMFNEKEHDECCNQQVSEESNNTISRKRRELLREDDSISINVAISYKASPSESAKSVASEANKVNEVNNVSEHFNKANDIKDEAPCSKSLKSSKYDQGQINITEERMAGILNDNEHDKFYNQHVADGSNNTISYKRRELMRENEAISINVAYSCETSQSEKSKSAESETNKVTESINVNARLGETNAIHDTAYTTSCSESLQCSKYDQGYINMAGERMAKMLNDKCYSEHVSDFNKNTIFNKRREMMREDESISINVANSNQTSPIEMSKSVELDTKSIQDKKDVSKHLKQTIIIYNRDTETNRSERSVSKTVSNSYTEKALYEAAKVICSYETNQSKESRYKEKLYDSNEIASIVKRDNFVIEKIAEVVEDFSKEVNNKDRSKLFEVEVESQTIIGNESQKKGYIQEENNQTVERENDDGFHISDQREQKVASVECFNDNKTPEKASSKELSIKKAKVIVATPEYVKRKFRKRKADREQKDSTTELIGYSSNVSTQTSQDILKQKNSDNKTNTSQEASDTDDDIDNVPDDIFDDDTDSKLNVSMKNRHEQIVESQRIDVCSRNGTKSDIKMNRNEENGSETHEKHIEPGETGNIIEKANLNETHVKRVTFADRPLIHIIHRLDTLRMELRGDDTNTDDYDTDEGGHSSDDDIALKLEAPTQFEPDNNDKGCELIRKVKVDNDATHSKSKSEADTQINGIEEKDIKKVKSVTLHKTDYQTKGEITNPTCVYNKVSDTTINHGKGKGDAVPVRNERHAYINGIESLNTDTDEHDTDEDGHCSDDDIALKLEAPTQFEPDNNDKGCEFIRKVKVDGDGTHSKYKSEADTKIEEKGTHKVKRVSLHKTDYQSKGEIANPTCVYNKVSDTTIDHGKGKGDAVPVRNDRHAYINGIESLNTDIHHVKNSKCRRMTKVRKQRIKTSSCDFKDIIEKPIQAFPKSLDRNVDQVPLHGDVVHGYCSAETVIRKEKKLKVKQKKDTNKESKLRNKCGIKNKNEESKQYVPISLERNFEVTVDDANVHEDRHTHSNNDGSTKTAIHRKKDQKKIHKEIDNQRKCNIKDKIGKSTQDMPKLFEKRLDQAPVKGTAPHVPTDIRLKRNEQTNTLKKGFDSQKSHNLHSNRINRHNLPATFKPINVCENEQIIKSKYVYNRENHKNDNRNDYDFNVPRSRQFIAASSKPVRSDSYMRIMNILETKIEPERSVDLMRSKTITEMLDNLDEDPMKYGLGYAYMVKFRDQNIYRDINKVISDPTTVYDDRATWLRFKQEQLRMSVPNKTEPNLTGPESYKGCKDFCFSTNARVQNDRSSEIKDIGNEYSCCMGTTRKNTSDSDTMDICDSIKRKGDPTTKTKQKKSSRIKSFFRSLICICKPKIDNENL